MANRHRMGDVAHSSQLLAPPVPAPVAPVAQPARSIPGSVPALQAPLRPVPPTLPSRLARNRRNPDLMARFGDAIRVVRTLRGFTQENLAFRTGLHRTQLSLIERGSREARLGTIVNLAAALHVNPGELLPMPLAPLPPAPPTPVPRL